MTRSQRNITPQYIVSETRLMHLLNELPCDVEGVVAKEIRSHPYNAGARWSCANDPPAYPLAGVLPAWVVRMTAIRLAAPTAAEGMR